MKANLENIHEIYNIFCQKNRMNTDIINPLGRFRLSLTLRYLKKENEKPVHEVKKLSNYQMCVLGMAKMDNRRYKVEGFMHNVHELTAKYESSKSTKDYKHKTYMIHIRLNGMMGVSVRKLGL